MFAAVRPVSLISSIMPIVIAVVVAFVSFLPLGAPDSVSDAGAAVGALCVCFTGRCAHLIFCRRSRCLYSASQSICFPLDRWVSGGWFICPPMLWCLAPRRASGRAAFFMTWIGFAVVTAIVSASPGRSGRSIFRQLIAPGPLMISCGLTIAVYPPMSKLFSWVVRPGQGLSHGGKNQGTHQGDVSPGAHWCWEACS